MEFKEVISWVSDDKPKTTTAVVVVSSCGVVKRLSFLHFNKKNNSYSCRKEHIYPQTTNRGKQRYEEYNKEKGKYLSVMIRCKAYSVHRLVALAWIPNPENKVQVNHLNGNRSDNRIDNLEWATNLENRQHANILGLHDYTKIMKVSKKQIKEIKKLRIKGYSIIELGVAFNVTAETIRVRLKEIMNPDEITKAKAKCQKRRVSKRHHNGK